LKIQNRIDSTTEITRHVARGKYTFKFPDLTTKSPGSLPRFNFSNNGQQRPRMIKTTPIVISVLAIYFASVANADNEDCYLFVLDFTNNAIVPDSIFP
jgi:hypothetical protein